MKSNMDIVRDFFMGKSDNYSKAKLGLKRVKESFEGFVIAFPDVTGDEIMFIKDKWETLPKNLSNGVKIMALSAKSGFKNFVTKYQSNSYIMPHSHKLEYEFGKVIKGSITNKLTGETYKKGDVYKFSPNELHYLSSKNGCLVQSTLTINDEYELESLTKKTLNRLEIA